MAVQVLENDFLKVEIDDHGAELCSVYDKNQKLERMWNADPAVWNRHAPILFPFVGKVKDGEYRYEGQTYQMATQHGFARDAVFTCVHKGQNTVTHRLVSDEKTRAIYPFDFILDVTHTLLPEEDGGKAGSGRCLRVEWTLTNTGDKTMYYSIGAHPGFAVPALPEEKRDQYFLEFPGKEKLEYILISPKSGLALPQEKYELTTEDGFVSIVPDFFDRDALIFEGGQVSCIRIATPDKKPYVTLYCQEFPLLGVWSKPEGRFVCLEPWMGRCDDDGFSGELQEKAGEQSLPARKTRRIDYTMEFHNPVH